MIHIGERQVAALDAAKLSCDVNSIMHVLTDVATDLGCAQPNSVAGEWLLGGVRIAQRYGIECGQEIAALALAVADLGPDFDLNSANRALADILSRDRDGGASSVAERVAAISAS